ncbi:uncharacterized protein METZ01_LOCUS4504 [marine metagenome]|uniref:Uncharacterized protein n=1 Tax=marine metagenome TaxID=408172 RepID=A0A381NAL1_9ZZZZ
MASSTTFSKESMVIKAFVMIADLSPTINPTLSKSSADSNGAQSSIIFMISSNFTIFLLQSYKFCNHQ